MIVISRKDFARLNIVVTNHALTRWNERIGNMADINTLTNYIQSIVKKDNGIYHQWENFYVLDNDILIVAVEANDIITIKTVFGRISLNPALRSMKRFIKNKKLYGKIIINKD